MFSPRSSRDRSSHTHEREHSLSQERWREGAGEGWREDRVEYADWEDKERSTSPDMARGRDRERSLSYERDRRSSSEERESGEIWMEEAVSKEFDSDTLFIRRSMEIWEHVGAKLWVRVSFVCVFMLKWDIYISRAGRWKPGAEGTTSVAVVRKTRKPAFTKLWIVTLEWPGSSTLIFLHHLIDLMYSYFWQW